MRRVVYPSDLTLEEWKAIKPHLPWQRLGTPHRVEYRRILNAILYLHHTGCPWRYLPKSYPRWPTVYYYFSHWSKNGTWERICHELHRGVRAKSLKSELPKLALIDAQSIRAARGEERAFDGHKKVLGRKRNILVDTLGIIFGCNVHAANQSETKTGKKILDTLPKSYEENLEKIIGDKGYRGALKDYAEYYHHGLEVQINDSKITGTNMKPWRWVVERTFAWLNHYRRMARDYECNVRNSESMLYISMLPILLHRITA